MKVPVGLDIHPAFAKQLHKIGPDAVIKVVGSLYGSKQAQRIWYKKLRETLLDIGFKPTISDPCVYQFRSPEGIILLAVYVDDLLTAVSSPKLHWSGLSPRSARGSRSLLLTL